MKTTAVFTSTISPKIMNWLNAHSKEKKVTKREVIERAIVFYRQNMIKAEMAASFKKASMDHEILEMAEEGMEDYKAQLTEHEL